MSVPILARNESIKILHYRPFRIAVLVFGAIMLATYIGAHVLTVRGQTPLPFALPGAWTMILRGPQVGLAAFFLSLLIILVTANEFGWRTARQNVIDGLSKEEWYVGKLLVIPAIALVLFVCVVPTGMLIALLGDDPVPDGPIVRASHLRAMGGFFLSMLGYGTFALFLSTTIRAVGSALGVFFLYAAFLESLIGFSLRRTHDALVPIAENLPIGVFNDVRSEGITLAAIVWMVALAVAGFLLFRYRDL